MQFSQEERAQAVQVGAVLLFGILVIFLSLYQAFVVPNQNEEIEFKHSEEVQQQMTELRSNVILMPDSSATRAASVDLGVRYPSRALFVNPGPAGGSLRTVGTESEEVNLTLRHVQAVTSEGETRDFWNGTTASYNTGAIEYLPMYNLYQFAPRTVYEHSVVYNHFESEDTTLALTEQALIDGKRISLIALNGSLSENRIDTVSVDFEPTSTRSRIVEVTDTGSPITIETPTNMNQTEWEELFEEELSDGYVNNVSVRDAGNISLLEIELQAGVNYELQLAKVGVGTGVTETNSSYLTDIEGNDTSVEIGATEQFTVETRDEFNVPQSSVQIEADAEGGSFSGNDTKLSDTEGQATFTYEAETSGTHQINFTIDTDYSPDSSHDSTSATNVSMTVTVPSPPSAGNGSAAYEAFWQEQHPFVESIGDIDGVSYDSSADEYEYNASKAGSLDLVAETDPTVEDATVDFAVSDTEIATVSPAENQTESDGKTRTTLSPKQAGTVRVFMSSGGSGDNVTFDITSVSTFTNLRLDVDPNTTATQAVHNWSFDAVDINCNDANCVDTITLDYNGEVNLDGSNLDTSDVTYSVSGNDDVSLNGVSVQGGSLVLDVNGVVTSDPNGGGYVRIDGTNGGLENPPSSGDYAASIEIDGRDGQSNDFATGTASYSIVEPANFRVSTISLPSSVSEGDDVVAEYLVENTGGLQNTQDIEFSVNGTTEDTFTGLTLDSGESQTIQFTYTTADADVPQITVAGASDNDSAQGTVDVTPGPFLNVTIEETNSPVPEGDDLDVNITVENTGGEQDTQTIELQNFTGDVVGQQSVQLDSGESTNFNLTWSTDDGDAGSDDITVTSENASVTESVDITLSGGFEVAKATDVIPYAAQQQQAFRFSLEPGNSLAAGETVTVILDDPHRLDSNDNPIQVSYTEENYEVVEGPGEIDNENSGSDTAFFTYKAPSGGLDPNEDVVIWAKEVKVGDLVDQNASYTVEFDRSDVATTANPTFSVDRDGRNANLSRFEVGNLSGTREQDINITFEPANGGFENNEWVTIELVDAASGISFNSENQVLAQGQGELDYESTTPRVRYQAPDSGFDGTVTIRLKDIEPTQEAVEYVVSASRGTAGTTETALNVTEGGTGLSNTRMTDLIPHADGEHQTITFTLDEQLPEDDYVMLRLNDSESPNSDGVIDYNAQPSTDDEGVGASVTLKTNGDVRIYYGNDTAVPAGTTVEMRVDQLDVGKIAEHTKNNPYVFNFSRSDFDAVETVPFNIERNTGQPELSDVAVTDFVGGSVQQDQEIRFTPTTGMSAVDGTNEKVAIDLTDTSEAYSSGVNGITVECSESNCGSATFNQNNDQTWVLYTAPDDGISAGTEITLTLEGPTPSDSQVGETYEVGFSRAVADTTNTTFDVVPENQILVFNNFDNGKNGDIEFNVKNEGGQAVDVTEFAVDATELGPNPTLDNGNDDELLITPPGSGTDGSAGRSGSYDADGTVYSLDQNATVPTNGNTDIELLGIVPSGFDLEKVANEAEADVVVTLVLDDGTRQDFYFRDTS